MDKNKRIKRSKIGSSYYDIEYTSNIKDENNIPLSGRIFEVTRKILVDKTESYQKQLQTLLHEDLHGICWEYGVVNDDIESMVKLLSNGMYCFIIDNPEYIKAILKYAGKKNV